MEENKEADKILDYKKVYKIQQTELEAWADLIQLIPQDKWVIREVDGVSVIFERETVAQALKNLV